MKKNPTGIRFQEEKTAFALAQLGLSSRQALVNYFLDSFWHAHHPASFSPAPVPPPAGRDEATQKKIDHLKKAAAACEDSFFGRRAREGYLAEIAALEKGQGR